MARLLISGGVMVDFIFSYFGWIVVVLVGLFVFSPTFRTLVFGLLQGAIFFDDDDCE